MGLNLHSLATQTGLLTSVTASQLQKVELDKVVPSHYTESVISAQLINLFTHPFPFIPRVQEDDNATHVASIIADAVLSVQVKALHNGVTPDASQVHLVLSVRIVSLHHNSSVVISLHAVN